MNNKLSYLDILYRYSSGEDSDNPPIYGVFNLNDVNPEYPKEFRKKKLLTDGINFFEKYCKLLLKPLQELTESSIKNDTLLKEFGIDSIYYVEDSYVGDFIVVDKKMYFKDLNYKNIPFMAVVYLVKEGYDFFNLIESGKALNITAYEE